MTTPNKVFCVDCQHVLIKTDPVTLEKEFRCTHLSERNIVSGEPMHVSCDEARYMGPCGVMGLNFLRKRGPYDV